METISSALILLLAVVVSGSIGRIIPFALPLPLVQIALGAAFASVATLRVELSPDIFFLLFLPPLLFLDGWRIPKEGLLRDKGTILELALGLVVFTVLGLGLLMHWMIPSMPPAVAFALAAIVSPTGPDRRVSDRSACANTEAAHAYPGRRVAAERCVRPRLHAFCRCGSIDRDFLRR